MKKRRISTRSFLTRRSQSGHGKKLKHLGKRRRNRVRSYAYKTLETTPFEYTSLNCPAVLDATSEDPRIVAETLNFFASLLSIPKRRSKQGVFIDMTDCVRVSPDAAFLLVAHADRVVRQHSKYAINGAYPRSTSVCNMLTAMQFDSFLGLVPASDMGAPKNLMMRSGLTVKGDGAGVRMPRAAADIAKMAAAELTLSTRNERLLASAINEALLNISRHAYDPENKSAPRSKLPPKCKRWYVTAAAFPDLNDVHVFVYDHGVTTPKTLHKDIIDEAVNYFQGKTEGHLLQAAIERRKTSSTRGGRGHGMGQMKELLGYFGNGVLDVRSGSGRYMVNGIDAYGVHETLTHRLPGTFIYWVLAPHEAKDVNDNA